MDGDRYWGCGLGFAVFFMTAIDLTHRNLAPRSDPRIPRVSDHYAPGDTEPPSDAPPSLFDQSYRSSVHSL